MRRSQLTGLGLVLAGILAWPSPAAAGFVDFIHEMTGPQFLGFGTTCKTRWVSSKQNPTEFRRGFRCAFFGLERLAHGDSWLEPDPSTYPTPPLEWHVEPAFYVSTPHNDDVSNEKRIYMIGVDPMLIYRPWKYKGIGHAVGLSWNHLFVPEADDTERTALKLRPVVVEIRGGLTVSWNVRYYWDGITAQDVQAAARSDADRRDELVWKSVSVGFYF